MKGVDTPLRAARSELSVPGSSWRMIEKAVASEADCVLIDLEDAVAPDQKVASRQNVIRALQDLEWGGKPPAYRINAVDTPYCYRDIIEVVEAVRDRIAMIVVPKVASAEDLHGVSLLLRQIELHVGLEPGRIALEAQIETAQGLVECERIAVTTDRLVRLTFGPGDYVASVRMPASSIGGMDRWDADYPGHRLHYAMSRLLVAGRVAGVAVVDGPMAEFRDMEAFRRSCLIARSLGCDGKWCIHPKQISIVNEAFSPTDEEVAWARRVIDAYQVATAEGRGAISIDDTLIDAASIRMAEATLALARRMAL